MQPISLALPQSDLVRLNPPEPGWFEAYDRTRLFYRHWAAGPESPVVVYLHGVEGHGQWFEKTASLLNQSGMSVYVPDRRGSGCNRQDVSPLLSYRQFLADIDCLLGKIRTNHPQSPVYLIGNCWGAKAAIAISRDYELVSIPINGLILICPALQVKCDVNLATKIQIGISWLLRLRRKFEIPLTPEMFTDNPDYIEYITRDPLRLTQSTASFFIETLKLRRLAQNSAGAIRIPLLVLQSGKDKISKIDAVRKWFERVASADKTMHVFPTMAHSLDFEPAMQEYVDLLIAWIAARSEKTQA